MKNAVLLLFHFATVLNVASQTVDQSAPIPEVRATRSEAVISSKNAINYNTDLFTGKFVYSIPIELPPGRNNCAPIIALSYNSAGGNGWCGVGWNLEVGYIERDTRRGVPATDDSKGFVFLLKGIQGRLVKVPGTSNPIQYRAEVDEASFQFFLHASGYWEARDKSGNVYGFGQTAESRQGISTGSGAFRWGMDHYSDANGNTVAINYTKHFNQMYLKSISYNGNLNTGLINPCLVQFEMEGRTDVDSTFMPGFGVTTAQRLQSISVYSGGAPVRQYVLKYEEPSRATSRSLLTSVQEFGRDFTTALPALKFTYQGQKELKASFGPLIEWGPVEAEDGDANWDAPGVSGSDSVSWTVGMLTDMNGDSLPDRVLQQKKSPFSHFWVQLNTGSGFESKIAWGPLANLKEGFWHESWNNLTLTSDSARLADFFDINGDALPDRVMNAVDDPYNHWTVQTNTGSGFSGLMTWPNVQSEEMSMEDWWARSSFSSHPAGFRWTGESTGGVKTQDMNGDGLPDRVMSRRDSADTKQFKVQINNGSSFDSMTSWKGVKEDYGLYSWLWINEGGFPTDSQIVDLIDINGDGLPDRILASPGGTDVNNYFKVQLNSGHGFGNYVNWGPLATAPGSGTGVSDWRWKKLTTTDHKWPWGSWGEHLVTWADMNGDGLVDRVLRDWPSLGSDSAYSVFRVQLNNGSGFRPAILWTGVAVPSNENYKPGKTSPRAYTSLLGEFRNDIADLVDMNGDGLPDRVMSSRYGDKFYVQLNQAAPPDLLVTIDNGIGGSVRVKYTPANLSDGKPTKHRIPIPMQIVSSIDTYDGTQWYDRTEYRYLGGWHDSLNREFNGFAQVTVYEPMDRATITYFHQEGARRGKAFQVDIYNTANGGAKLLKRNLSKVEEVPTRDDGTASYFPFLSRSITMDYASPTKYRASARDFYFNRFNGNVTGTVGYGEVINVNLGNFDFSDLNGGDNHYATNHYEPNTTFTRRILDRVKRSEEASNQGFLSASLLRQTYFRYDINGNVLTKKRWLRDGSATGQYSVEQSTYDAFGNLETSLNPVNLLTVTEYDDATKTFPKRTTMGGSFVEEFTYDVRSGQLLRKTDVKGQKTRFIYDTFFRLTEIQIGTTPHAEPSLWVEKFGYQFDGMGVGFEASRNYLLHQVNDATGINGHESFTYFDGYGRPIQKKVEAEANWRVTDTFYNARGELIFSTLPRFGSWHEFTKDAGPFKGTTYSHDTLGRVLEIVPAEVTISETHAVEAWRPITGDDGSPTDKTTTSYNWNGTNPWVQTTTDPAGKQKMLVYDGFGRVEAVKEKNGLEWFTTRYTYSQIGELLTIKDHHGNIITYRYDTLGRKTRETHPNTGTLSYTYDLAGKITEQATPEQFTSIPKGGGPRKLKMFYEDPLGRITKKQAWQSGALESVIHYTYDTGTAGYTVYKGQLASMTDSEGWEKYSYDVRGRLLSKTRFLDLPTPQTFTISRTYDDADRVVTLTYPGGASILHEYDNAGNLYRIKTASGFGVAKTIYQANEFSAMGNITDASYGNSVRTTYAYYAQSKRLANVRTFLDAGGTSSADYRNVTYQYDEVGNAKNIIDNRYLSANSSERLEGAVYDDLHRLVQVGTPQGIKNYSYSPIGNFVVNGEAGNGVYKFLTAGKPHAVSAANGQAFVYDSFGNVIIQKTNGLADAEYTYSYSYDSQNRMTHANRRGHWQIKYGYDWAGKRLWKNGSYMAPLGAYSFSLNPQQIWIGELFEIKDGKSLCHVHANGKQIATIEPGNATDRVWYYYHGDYLGSTSVLTDDSGAVVQRYVNTSYGKQRYQKSESAFPVSNRYTGMPLDEDTGLYYFGFRYYSPSLGIFIQPDTVIPDLYNPQSFNPYGYALYNPLRYTDPTGHAGAEIAQWWSATVDAKFQCLTAGSTSTLYIGLLGTVNSLVGDLADPLALGSDAGRVSFEGGSAFDIAAVTLTEVSRAASLVPLGAVVGKGAGEVLDTAGDIMKAKSAGTQAAKTITGNVSEEGTTITVKAIAARGRRGNQATQNHIDTVRDEFLDSNPEYRHIAGGRDRVTGAEIPEEYIPGPGGARKGSSYPDLTFEANDGSRIRINTVDTKSNGRMSSREQANFDRIFEQTREPIIAVPKPR